MCVRAAARGGRRRGRLCHRARARDAASAKTLIPLATAVDPNMGSPRLAACGPPSRFALRRGKRGRPLMIRRAHDVIYYGHPDSNAPRYVELLRPAKRGPAIADVLAGVRDCGPSASGHRCRGCRELVLSHPGAWSSTSVSIGTWIGSSGRAADPVGTRQHAGRPRSVVGCWRPGWRRRGRVARGRRHRAGDRPGFLLYDAGQAPGPIAPLNMALCRAPQNDAGRRRRAGRAHRRRGRSPRCRCSTLRGTCSARRGSTAARAPPASSALIILVTAIAALLLVVIPTGETAAAVLADAVIWRVGGVRGGAPAAGAGAIRARSSAGSCR